MGEERSRATVMATPKVGERAERQVIAFYSTKGEYSCLSNFAAYPFELGGVVWPTAEHYFQAQKFAGTKHEDAIRLVRSPMVAAHMGRTRQRPLRADWERVKDEVMLAGLRAKFAQHADIRAKLLATGDAMIVEHTRKDRYWGDGGDGSGLNMLGRLLMRVRDELRQGRQQTRSDNGQLAYCHGILALPQPPAPSKLKAAVEKEGTHGPKASECPADVRM